MLLSRSKVTIPAHSEIMSVSSARASSSIALSSGSTARAVTLTVNGLISKIEALWQVGCRPRLSCGFSASPHRTFRLGPSVDPRELHEPPCEYAFSQGFYVQLSKKKPVILSAHVQVRRSAGKYRPLTFPSPSSPWRLRRRIAE
jgi:hypothetical protein